MLTISSSIINDPSNTIDRCRHVWEISQESKSHLVAVIPQGPGAIKKSNSTSSLRKNKWAKSFSDGLWNFEMEHLELTFHQVCLQLTTTKHWWLWRHIWHWAFFWQLPADKWRGVGNAAWWIYLSADAVKKTWQRRGGRLSFWHHYLKLVQNGVMKTYILGIMNL